jgi:hypothetical protein
MNRGMVFIIATLVFAIVAFGLMIAGHINLVPQLKPVSDLMLQPWQPILGSAQGGRMYGILIGLALAYGAVLGLVMAGIFGTKE